MDYHLRSSLSPPPTAKVKHHHRHSLTSCFRFASCDGGEPVESPRHSRTFHPKVHFCFGGGKHRRRHSSGFRYDALSYALNFDEGSDDDSPTGDELLRIRSHSSRPQALSPRDGLDGFDDQSRIRGNVNKDVPLRLS
ncbi:uncharacterized protein LOC122029338 [Zingiber officinale]|nr:uncharacterized protein LOC122029338 [Zingiber officinale]